MPTYTYSGTTAKTFRFLSEKLVTVEPGESFETYEYQTDSDLTKTADTPLYNPIAASTLVTLSSTAADHVLNDDTTKILIVSITGTVTAKPQVDTAIAVLLDASSSDPAVLIPREKKYFDRLRLSGSGTCTVMEYR